MSDFVKGISKLFNEIIALVVPGFIFLYLFFLVLGKELPTEEVYYLLAFSYAAGQVLLSIYDNVSGMLSKCFSNTKDDYKEYNPYKIFKHKCDEKFEEEGCPEELYNNLSFNDYRSMAMTVSSEAADLGRKFMFVSIFYSGLLASLTLTVPLLAAKHIFTLEYGQCEKILLTVFSCFVYVIVVKLTILRSKQSFESRAMKVPFSCALITDGHES